jgi:hypothetical protein
MTVARTRCSAARFRAYYIDRPPMLANPIRTRRLYTFTRGPLDVAAAAAAGRGERTQDQSGLERAWQVFEASARRKRLRVGEPEFRLERTAVWLAGADFVADDEPSLAPRGEAGGIAVVNNTRGPSPQQRLRGFLSPCRRPWAKRPAHCLASSRVRTLTRAKPPISFFWAASGQGGLLVRADATASDRLVQTTRATPMVM